ncbi:hypothetical protein Q1Z72_00730 [Pseudomonas qingdaonensis]|uniref:hypothetical protein n=1 Tax=Pseudomonas TaxID=286 RepID=UPI0021189037|nr:MULTISPECIES: hypothetical protein [Pseudomonas]ELQ8316839.1 hypothetical protein [Pseudomonas aeruginosa]UXH55987.1 hypothetical protein N5876_32460 [Pseudomonas aeruginosa]UXH69018.1 hypothetical protein N5879_32485 [Pseudomonas aeruginosa]WKL67233.1 hypothetical protein Q1Z72_00730 [Pseudomonas qingdaonensis]
MSNAEQSQVEQVLASPATSTWLRNALTEALQRDPIDAANDAEALSELLSARCEDLLQKATR